MKIFRRFLSLLAVTMAAPLLSAQDAFADPATECNGQKFFFPWECGAKEDNIQSNIIMIFNWLAIGVSVVVVLMVIIGAIQYMSAGGSQENAKKGMETIRNAIIALVLYLIMWALLNFLVPGGIFA